MITAVSKMNKKTTLSNMREELEHCDVGRLPRAPQLNLPLPIAQRWAMRLPGEIEPRALLQRFPRIANNLARLWSDRQAIAGYVDELLIDRRGDRQGFPPDVHMELLNLKDFIDGRYGNFRPR